MKQGPNVGANHQAVVPPGPCDGCGLRATCATGQDCRAYRAWIDGAKRSKVMQWRGHRLRISPNHATTLQVTRTNA